MTDDDLVRDATGYELLCLLAGKHGWKLGLYVDRDLAAGPQRRTQLSMLEVVYDRGAPRYVRRALGPGDENVETAAWEILNSLRLLGVLVLRGGG